MSPYGALSTEFYALDKPEAPPDAFEFYEAFAREARGPIHEPMCGTGRYLLGLLERGLDASGSDASPHMLEACRVAARQRHLSPSLSQQSLEALYCERPPALLFIPSGSFGLLIDDALVKASLRRVHQVLAPGGRFLVEAERVLPGPAEPSGVWGGRWVDRPDGARLVFSWLVQYSGAPDITTSLHRYELLEGGKLVATELEELRVRSYVPEDFRSLLEAAGFVDIEALKPYERAPADDSDDAVVFSARRA
jgi:SAM-dependent methyltransferase